jgi:hypothetical protein
MTAGLWTILVKADRAATPSLGDKMMIRQGLFACLAMSMAWAPALSVRAADLEDGESRATLAVVAKAAEMTIDGRNWHCEGTACWALPTAQADVQRITTECHNAAKHLGKFAAYQTGRKILTDAQITDCNAGL